MNKHKKLFLQSIIQIEPFNYIVPLPVVAYVVIILGGYAEDLKSTISILVSFIIVVLITLAQGIMEKYKYVGISEEIYNSKTEQNLIEVKKKLLNMPLKEGISASNRWIYGVSSAPIIASLFVDFSIRRLAFGIVGGLLAAPLGFIINYIGSERFNYKLLSEPKLIDINIQQDQVIRFTLVHKITILVLSILWASFISFICLGYGIFNNIIDGSTAVLNYSIVIAGMLFVSIMTLVKIVKSINISLKDIVYTIDSISKGDLTVQTKVTTCDEIGIIARSLIIMKDIIANIVNQTINQSKDISKMVSYTNEQIKSLNNDVQDVVDTTSQLAANTQETAASTEEINSTAIEVEKTVSDAEEDVKEDMMIVHDIRKRADTLRESAISSHENAKSVYLNTQNKLSDAMEQLKAIDEINVLSNSILNIASETNLLALNAAIEAARAGEAGRGFAVVADEIRKLADDSSKTVGQIQNVNKNVVNAANSLLEFSNQLLSFIEDQVIKDYESMVETGEHYKDDASLVEDLMNKIQSALKHLLEAISNITETVSQVSSASNDIAEGTQNIMSKTNSVSGGVTSIAE